MAGPGVKQVGAAARAVRTLVPWLGFAGMTALWLRTRHRSRGGLSREETAPPEHFEAIDPGRGRLADRPARIPVKGWRDILWRTYQEVGHDRLQAVAGGVTFYVLLAVFPAMGVFVSLYGLFADVGAVSRQLGQLAAFVPSEVLGILGDQMTRLAVERSSHLSAAFAVSLFLSVWSANAGIAALFDGLNVAYDETEKRNIFQRRVLTLGFTFALLLFVTAVTGLMVGLPLALERLGWAQDQPWLIPFRWVLLLALAACAFAVLYRYGPSRQRARWRWLRYGAAAAAVVWVVGSLAFSWWLNNVAHFDVTYGSLAAVVGFMMWIWFSTMAVLVGAELNAEVEHQTALDSTTGPPAPMGQRGAVMADTVGLPFKGLRGLLRDLERQVEAVARRLPGRRR